MINRISTVLGRLEVKITLQSKEIKQERLIMKKMVQVVEEKVDLIKEESPWKEEIEQLSHKKSILTS